MKKETDNSSQELKESSTDDIPKKLSKEDSIVNQGSLRLISDIQNQTVSKEGFESVRSNKRKEGSIKPKGGFGFYPNSGERGREREEVLKPVQEITKGNGEKAPIQNSRGTAPYPRGEILTLRQAGKGWSSLIVDMTSKEEINLGIIVMLIYPMRVAI